MKTGGATGPRIAPSNVVISDKSGRNRDFGSHGAAIGGAASEPPCEDRDVALETRINQCFR